MDIGPVYYWCLWLGRVALTPWLGSLPHTGGWFVALLETAADGVLLLALSRKLRSTWLAATIVVFAATAPPGASLSAVIWNPPLAEAFAKLTTASVLWPGAVTLARCILTALLAICAGQCHVSAVLVAIPLVTWSLWALGREQGRRALIVATLVIASGLALWATIYAGYPAEPERASPGPVLASIARVVANPLAHLRPIEAANGVLNALESLLLMPLQAAWFEWALLLGAAVLLARERDRSTLVASVLPIVFTVAALCVWQGSFSELYWFLVLIPAAVLCLAGPVIVSRGRLRLAGIITLATVTCALQPARARVTWTEWKQPAYGPLAVGVSAAAASGVAVRAIRPDFHVPPGMDPLFMFSLAGGRLDEGAPLVLVIEPDGGTRYEAAP